MKKGVINMVTGAVNQLILVGMGIVLTRLFILSFGSEANGMVATINQVFIYFTLFEAGLMTVCIQSLYGPVARGDRAEINGVLSASQSYFKRTGIVYLAAMLGFASIFPFIVSSDIPKLEIAVVILLQGGAGVLNYFFQARHRCLLEAQGKVYVLNNLLIFINLFSNGAKIAMLLMGFPLIVVQSAYFAVSVISLVILNVYMKKKYAWIDSGAKANLPAVEGRRHALVHQCASLVFNNTDMLVLSVFLGFGVASVYALYLVVFTMASSIVAIAVGSVLYKLGHKFNVDEQNYPKYFECFESYYMVLVFSVMTVAYIFILPFLTLYTQEITDINYIDQYLPILFLAVNLLSSGRIISGATINFAKHFKQTKWRTVAEMAINVGVSVVAVNIFGIYGVLLGTVAALLYRTNDMIIYANKIIMKRSPFSTYRRWILNVILLLGLVFVSKHIVFPAETYLQILLFAALTFVVAGALFFLLSVATDTNSYKILKSTLKRRK